MSFLHVQKCQGCWSLGGLWAHQRHAEALLRGGPQPGATLRFCGRKVFWLGALWCWLGGPNQTHYFFIFFCGGWGCGPILPHAHFRFRGDAQGDFLTPNRCERTIRLLPLLLLFRRAMNLRPPSEIGGGGGVGCVYKWRTSPLLGTQIGTFPRKRAAMLSD